MVRFFFFFRLESSKSYVRARIPVSSIAILASRLETHSQSSRITRSLLPLSPSLSLSSDSIRWFELDRPSLRLGRRTFLSLSLEIRFAFLAWQCYSLWLGGIETRNWIISGTDDVQGALCRSRSTSTCNSDVVGIYKNLKGKRHNLSRVMSCRGVVNIWFNHSFFIVLLYIRYSSFVKFKFSPKSM